MVLTFGNFSIEKEIAIIDQFVIDFTKVLDQEKISYVLISGYVPILFGRNRLSEDVDLFIGNMSYEQFSKLWTALKANFECIITSSPETAYSDYLKTGHAIRFSRKEEFIPNMEIKFVKNDLDSWTLKNKKLVSLDNHSLYISPIESQIAFKLHLGSEKDIEDARYLYKLLKDTLNEKLLLDFVNKLNVKDNYEDYIQ